MDKVALGLVLESRWENGQHNLLVIQSHADTYIPAKT